MNPELKAEIELCLGDTSTEWGSSRWAAWRRCKRESYLAYDVKLERVIRDDDDEDEGRFGGGLDYFAVGHYCHGILRYMQRGAVKGEERRWEDVTDYLGMAVDGPPPELLEEVYRLMRFYWEFWGTANGGWPSEATITGIEEYLETPPELAVLPHTGRADTILEIGGQIVVVDTKTRKNKIPDDIEKFRRKARTRAQFVSLSGMLQMKLKLDEPPAVMVNAIVKTKLPQMQRVIVDIRQVDVDRWIEDHKANAATALDQQEAAALYVSNSGISDVLPYVYPRNLDSCAPELGSPCRFYGYCHALSDEERALNWGVKAKVLP